MSVPVQIREALIRKALQVAVHCDDIISALSEPSVDEALKTFMAQATDEDVMAGHVLGNVADFYTKIAKAADEQWEARHMEPNKTV